MKDDELFVVPAERHVERLAREGKRGETRASLRARLAAAFLPDVRFADARETRLTLAVALEEARAQGQLDLFGAAPEDADALLAALRERGGASWALAAAAIDEAVGALRSRGATEAHLDRVRGGGVTSTRARTLAAAMRALDDVLARAGARDGRLLGPALAGAIHRAGPALVATVVSSAYVRARWLLSWESHDLAWWRALDETLSRAGGHARVVLPVIDKRLEGGRERDPLEIIADAVARSLDAAPEAESIPAVLGDLASSPPDADAASRVRILRTADARSEARVVARLVRAALDEGASIERVVIAYPERDERTLVPLRHELEAEGIVAYDALGPPPSSVPVVAAALSALAAAESLDRVAVARVLRSGYVDGSRVVGDPADPTSLREADKRLARLARALETRATAAGADALERLVLTAAAGGGEDEAAARQMGAIFARARSARTREGRVRAARGLLRELGFAARAGRGALGTFARDEAPSGIDRAERLAVARDVRAWEVLEGALDAYETIVLQAGAGDRPLASEVFRLELGELLDASAQLPGAGRAGAVRVARLADVTGDALDLLVVLDVNDGVLPRDVRPVTLVTEGLEAAVTRAAQGTFVATNASELAARDLAALAMGAAEARRVVLVTTTEDGTDAPASPSRLLLALERSGCGQAAPAAAPASRVEIRGGLASRIEIERRSRREREREGFFLDPMRQQSDIVGTLAPSDELRRLVEAETGISAERALAVTSIERFAQCSFKGYAHVVLAARESEEQHELPDAREEGNLGHSALAAAFLATRDDWPRRPRDVGAIVAKGLAAAEVVLAASAGHAPLRAIVRLRVRESVRAVLVRACEDEEWDFILAEHAFGKGKAWPPFGIADGQTTIWLRGSVDRVDRAHDGSGVRVVDYKRSMSTVRDSSSSSLGETVLQVPIYAAVVARKLEVPATGAYVPMQARDIAAETKARSPRRAGGPEERIGDLARREAPGMPSEIERRVLRIAAAAREGRFAPLPARESECTYCAVSGGCRKPRFAMTPADEIDEGTEP